MIVTAFTAASMSGIASVARQRNSLVILNQSTTATIWVAFDTPAIATPTAGQITIGPLGSGGQDPGAAGFVFHGPPGSIPWQSIHIIASAGNTPVTILE